MVPVVRVKPSLVRSGGLNKTYPALRSVWRGQVINRRDRRLGPDQDVRLSQWISIQHVELGDNAVRLAPEQSDVGLSLPGWNERYPDLPGHDFLISGQTRDSVDCDVIVSAQALRWVQLHAAIVPDHEYLPGSKEGVPTKKVLNIINTGAFDILCVDQGQRGLRHHCVRCRCVRRVCRIDDQSSRSL